MNNIILRRKPLDCPSIDQLYKRDREKEGRKEQQKD